MRIKKKKISVMLSFMSLQGARALIYSKPRLSALNHFSQESKRTAGRAGQHCLTDKSPSVCVCVCYRTVSNTSLGCDKYTLSKSCYSYQQD